VRAGVDLGKSARTGLDVSRYIPTPIVLSYYISVYIEFDLLL